MSPVVPTLMYIPNPVLKDPADITAYLVMFFLQNVVFSQGDTQKTGMHLSFQTLSAKHTEPEVLANMVCLELKRGITRCVPDSDPDVNCTVEKNTVEQTFKLQLMITDPIHGNLLRATMFTIDKHGAVVVHYNRTGNRSTTE